MADLPPLPERVDARARDSPGSGDFYFVYAADVEKGVRKLLTIVQERLGVGPPRAWIARLAL